DDTFLPVPAGEIAWSVRSGLVAGLSTGGLVLTAPVIRPTDVLFDGTYKSLTDPDGTLLNVNDLGETDFFQQYAGDRIDDGWQLEYFGLPPNARAAPTVDADGDGRDNWMEFLSGFSPVDSKAFLDFKIQGFSSANVMDFRINKILPGRTYIVRANTDLQSFPQTVGSPIDVPAEQTNRLFQDPAASEGKKFYFLQITRH
ncbi:MAG: hypothetical protein JWL81_1708, partial [Verrucomicrobiales bacterium]|nr:hypothetical protein [Verrucomicrobiales bacterium]